MLVLLGWYALSLFGLLPEFILPLPHRIVHTAIQDFDVLLPHALHTLYIAVLGIGISIVCAFVFALLLDISSFLHSLFFPVILFFQMVPVILFAPLFVIIFGYGTGTKLIIVVLMCFFPILVTLLQGFRYVSKDTISLLRSMGAKKFAIYRWGKIPSALVEMFSGLRLAVSYAVTASILSEWVGAVQGLGFVMIQSQKAFLIERVYVVIGAIFLMSIVLYLLVILIEFFFISKKQKGKILLKKEEEI